MRPGRSIPGSAQTDALMAVLPRAAQTAASRHLSLRQAAALGPDLYLARILSFDDTALLAAEPLLHPAYARTVARLAENPSSPQPNRALPLWEDRLHFAGSPTAA